MIFMGNACTGGGSNSGGGGGGANTPSPDVCAAASSPVLPALLAQNGIVGTPYSFTSGAVTGGILPYTVALVSGNLPAGLAAHLSSATVTITGTPTAPGTSSGMVKVSDACQKSVTAQVTITVNPTAMVDPWSCLLAEP